ncbi:hypothetical protein D9Q98_005710 [Chlorella vulgaris]|uniref:Uncharacterized protein n=1 Tax=Chlorella vulgaris TaxID=3077 RepID=A0A9D4YWE0_CHLVU|nr:hypothetical protein D9Q98_005710 [Chlorella vulgaris]
MLGLKQADLQRDCDQQERKLAAAQQRMASLQLQMRQLVAQQKEVSAMIDPEAAAAVRQAAVEAAERAEVEGRRDVFITLVGIIAFYGVAATSISREIGENRRRNNARDGCMLD